MIADLYSKPLPDDVVEQRTDSDPIGWYIPGAVPNPAPTGYYPNARNHLQHPITGYAVPDDQPWYGREIQDFLHDAETIDQHMWVQVSATWTPAEDSARLDGQHDPLTDGPPPPTLRDLTEYYYRRCGTSQTRFLDVPGIVFPATGQQDGASWTYVQDVQRTLMLYDPSQVDDDGDMPDTLRAYQPSPPHGWTARTVKRMQQENIDKAQSLTQQQGGGREYLAGSTYAGQSFSTASAQVGGATANVPSRRPRG